MPNKNRPKGLGRGLEVLLGSEPASLSEDAPHQLSLHRLQPGRYQPRTRMDEQALQDLADSIVRHGVMQPILVRPLVRGNSDEGPQRYEIIAGERRFRAARMAGLSTVPVIVREVADDQALSMALIENIQREDLNPMEEAIALSRLQEEFTLTHQQVADAVGKSRVTVTNLLRLMGLSAEARRMLEHGDIEMGHARAILSLDTLKQTEAARIISARDLSVRQTEALVRRLQLDPSAKPSQALDPDIRVLQNDLSEKIGAPVIIQHGAKGKGKLVIRYGSLDELDGILAHIR